VMAVVYRELRTSRKASMRNAVRALIIAIAVSATSCASDVANRYYGTEKFAPKRVEDVQLLSRAPDRAYDVIADLQSRHESPHDLREKAAALGADAVIVTMLGGYSAFSEEWAKQENTAYTHIVGTAIRFR
jgi:hypothetical protein